MIIIFAFIKSNKNFLGFFFIGLIIVCCVLGLKKYDFSVYCTANEEV